MCGINGIVSFHPAALPIDLDELMRTREAMRSRGPDACGIWLSADRRTGLGHRRLSIIDVSDRANQPMHSRDRRMVLTFNGEIYNFAELRADLQRDGETFETTSDTEVVLRAYERWGDAAVDRLHGMFEHGFVRGYRAQPFDARQLVNLRQDHGLGRGRAYGRSKKARHNRVHGSGRRIHFWHASS